MHEYIVNFWLKTVVIFSLLYLMPQQVYEHTFISFLTSSWMSRTVFGGDLLNNLSLEEKQLKKKKHLPTLTKWPDKGDPFLAPDYCQTK